jgi:hypothetical protein
MTIEEFREQHELYRERIKDKGSLVAEAADISYPSYRTYLSDPARTNAKVRARIVHAFAKVAGLEAVPQ